MKKIVVLLLITAFLLHAVRVFADPTDSGQILVKATIPPLSSYFTTAITSNKNDSLAQNTEVTYTVTYSSTYASSSDVTLQVDWTQGTISGASLATVDIAEYVLGSASTAYNGTAPLIDPVNKTITWHITNFPPDVEGAVTFKLRTTSNYQGDNSVSFTVNTHISEPVVTEMVNIAETYVYEKTTNTSSTTISTPTPTAASSQTLDSPDQGEAAVNTALKNILIKEIGPSSASIIVETTSPSSLKIRYGTSQGQLSKTVVILEPDSLQNFVLTGLSPATKYYFQVEQSNGALLISDTFLFTTALSSSQIPDVKPQSLIVTQKGSILYNGGVVSDIGTAPPITAVSNSVIEMYITIPKDDSLRSVELFVSQWKILGFQDDVSEEFQSSNALLNEVTPQTYSGKLKVPEEIGEYQIMVRMKDVYGNFKEFTLVKIRVISNLVITDAISGKPINHAKISLYLFNSEKRLFEYIPPATTSIKNPTYSDQNGIVFLNLAPGVYKIIVQSFGYKDTELQFGIGVNESFNLPTVTLHSISNIVIIQKLLHWVSSLLNLLLLFSEQMKPIAASHSFYNFMLMVSCILCMSAGLFGYYLKKHPHINVDQLLIYHRKFMTQQIMSFILYIVLELIVFMSEFFTFFAVIYIYLFTLVFGFWETLPFIVIVLIAISLMTYDSYVYIKRKT